MYNEIVDFFVEKLECKKEDISENSELVSFGVDSLKLLMILEDFEEKFNVSISDEEIENIHTIKDLVELCQKQ